MRALATVILAVLDVPVNALAQGTIDFHNPNTFPLKVLDMRDGSVTTLGAPGSPLGPGSMRVGLFIGTGTSFASLTMVGMTTNSSSTLPLFVGTFNGGNPFTIAGHPQNEVGSFGFAAWSISTGALTYQAALTATSGYVSDSVIGQGYVLAGGATTPAPTFGNPTAAQPWLINRGITFTVPEPSAISLGIAGTTVLCLLRRRK